MSQTRQTWQPPDPAVALNLPALQAVQLVPPPFSDLKPAAHSHTRFVVVEQADASCTDASPQLRHVAQLLAAADALNVPVAQAVQEEPSS